MSKEYKARSLDDVFEVIYPHIMNKDPLKSLNRLLRKRYFTYNKLLHGNIVAYKNLIYLPYINEINSKVNLVSIDINEAISYTPDSFCDDRRPPYKYNTPIVIVRHRGMNYRLDGGKRLRYLYFKAKSKTVDVLLVTVTGEAGKFYSLSSHIRDRIIANLVSK